MTGNCFFDADEGIETGHLAFGESSPPSDGSPARLPSPGNPVQPRHCLPPQPLHGRRRIVSRRASCGHPAPGRFRGQAWPLGWQKAVSRFACHRSPKCHRQPGDALPILPALLPALRFLPPPWHDAPRCPVWAPSTPTAPRWIKSSATAEIAGKPSEQHEQPNFTPGSFAGPLHDHGCIRSRFGHAPG